MISINLHSEWKDLPVKSIYTYIKNRNTIGHNAAVLKLVERHYPRAYKVISRHRSEEEKNAVLLDIVEHYAFLLEAPDYPIIHKFHYKGQWHYFPKAQMEHSCYNEFMLADRYYTYMIAAEENNDTEDAYYNAIRLLITIARPLGDRTQPDPRVPVMHESDIKKTASAMTEVSSVAVIAGIKFFSATKNFVHEKYGPWLFPAGESKSTIQPDVNLAWLGMAMSVAKSGAFGNHLDQVLSADFHSVCAFMMNEVSLSRAQARAQSNASG